MQAPLPSALPWAQGIEQAGYCPKVFYNCSLIVCHEIAMLSRPALHSSAVCRAFSASLRTTSHCQVCILAPLMRYLGLCYGTTSGHRGLQLLDVSFCMIFGTRSTKHEDTVRMQTQSVLFTRMHLQGEGHIHAARANPSSEHLYFV